MAQKRCNFTDQEWLSLIQDCRTSGLTVNTWCEQHGITHKAFYYHIRKLRQKGFSIPQKTSTTPQAEKQEVFCLDLSEERSSDSSHPSAFHNATALRMDFNGVRIEITNQATQDTISNTLLALQGLC